MVQNENGNNELNGAVAEENTDFNQVVTTKAPVESESYSSKSSTECEGCVKKAAERDEWEYKYKQEVESRKELKKVYMNLNIQFSELYMKHNDLLKTASNIKPKSFDDPAACNDVFSSNEIKFLQFMPLDKKNDCSFILNALKYAYKSDTSVLVSKTLKGKSEWTEIKDGYEIHHDAKTPLTPEKVERIKGLFIDRISNCEIHSADYGERIKDSYMNKLFAAGIKNISKKFK